MRDRNPPATPHRMNLVLPKELHEHALKAAANDFTTVTGYIKRLIVEDMRSLATPQPRGE